MVGYQFIDKMKLIVATNHKNYLGKDGKMMWRSSEDFRHFKQMTMGSILIVGRITFEHCLGGKELPGRKTIVIGHGNENYYPTIFEGLNAAVELQKTTHQEIWVIGGAQIYNALVYLCDEIHQSNIENVDDGDVKFIIPLDYKGNVFLYNFKTN